MGQGHLSLGPGFSSLQWGRLLAGFLLTLHAALLLHAAPRQAPTVDEIWHLPAGVSYWTRGEFWCYHHNPPLMRWLYSLPAVIVGADVDYSRYVYRPMSRQADFEFGRDFMAANRDRYLLLFAVCRPIVIATSVACGWLIWHWSQSLFGSVGGLVSLWLWVFLPESLTHSMFLTTDVGATFFGFLATWFFWQYLRVPSTYRAMCSGLALGLAEGAKYSCIILPLIWGVLVIFWWRRLLARRISKRSILIDALIVLFTSVLTLNNLYMFDGFGRPLGEFPFYSRTLTTGHEYVGSQFENRFQNSWLSQIPLPLPEQYVLGFDAQLADVDHGEFQKYLCGTLKKGGGWWYYYLYAASVKLPVGTLAVMALTLISAFMPTVACGRRSPLVHPLDDSSPMNPSLELMSPPASQVGCRAWALDELTLLTPAVLYLIAVSSNTGLQYFRYAMPIFPFVFVLCGRLGTNLANGSLWRQAIVCLALLSIPVSVLRYHPYYLPYFNELAGGPQAGPKHLGDSSVDWGEGLLALRDWVQANRPGEPLRLAYFGTIAPSIVGLSDVEVPPFLPACQSEREGPEEDGVVGPAPGLQAVSVSYVQGYSFPTPHQNIRDVIHVPPGAYSYYRYFQPIAKPAHSIWVFDLSLDEVNQVRAELGLPDWREDHVSMVRRQY